MTSSAIRIGVVGGGQLGRMLAIAAAPLNCTFTFLEPSAASPIQGLGKHLHGSFSDRTLLEKLISDSDIITVELEHVPLEALEILERSNKLYPGLNCIATAQDRLLEKSLFVELNIPCAKFLKVDSYSDAESALKELGAPYILKTRRDGYDGKGQLVVNSLSDLEKNFSSFAGKQLIAESFVNFSRELSIIACRSRQGQTCFYPLTENKHLAGILRKSTAPAPNITRALENEAQELARKITDKLNYVGTIAIELFQTPQGLMANEIAPRVHNSGHWTLDGANVSQFENHIRAVAGLELVTPKINTVAVMLNVLGHWPTSEQMKIIKGLPGVSVYVYGKSEAAKRKIGHINCVASSEADAEKTVAQIEAALNYED